MMIDNSDAIAHPRLTAADGTTHRQGAKPGCRRGREKSPRNAHSSRLSIVEPSGPIWSRTLAGLTPSAYPHSLLLSMRSFVLLRLSLPPNYACHNRWPSTSLTPMPSALLTNNIPDLSHGFM
ncbi:hypothetical protein NECAME_02618 [Necator americanus]|uniref:Uncharacterized protein n=1 Tax=Necator americanus TaxID=51031 RepID=W2TD26_NECAM|nr:hypothetical protein NECAME_02618 [Necator americanus]ETN79499.1 hypothetical protein NECAME_02618 [Necator americanus]